MGRNWRGLAALSGAVALAVPGVVLAQQPNERLVREARLDDQASQRSRPGSALDAANEPAAKPDIARSRSRAGGGRSRYAERREGVQDAPSAVRNIDQRQLDQLPNRPVTIPTGPVRPVRAPDEPFIVSGGGITIVIDGHYTRANVPTLSGGTQFDPALLKEVSIVKSPGVLNGGGGGGTIVVPLRGGAKLFTNFRVSDFDGTSTGLVPIGGNNVAQTYIFPNQVSGSTGIAAGATGQSVSISSQGQFIDVATGVTWDYPALAFDGLPMSMETGFGFRYRNYDRKDSITQQSLFFSDLSSNISLDAKSNYYAANFVGGLKFDPRGPTGFIGGARGMFSLGVLSTDATASQLSHCGPCGAASPEFNVNLSRDFSESKFAWAAGVTGYAGYQFNPNAKLLFEISYEHLDSSPVFSVPKTPVEQPIKLDYGSIDTLRIGGKLVYDFAPTSRLQYSDARLKRDVAELGRLGNGLALYRYRYLWSDVEYVGVMAQEVEAVMPDAVVRGADGFLRVDYARLDTRLMTFDEWTAAR
jgi:hypothetical protein